MESGFQSDVVSNVGAVGVMQLLPGTWEWVDEVLLGTTTPRTYEGNVRAGVRYLRWLLDEFGGDRRLALAGYYQGARAVREHGLFEDGHGFGQLVEAEQEAAQPREPLDLLGRHDLRVDAPRLGARDPAVRTVSGPAIAIAIVRRIGPRRLQELPPREGRGFTAEDGLDGR